MENQVLKGRYFRVEYSPVGGGQVEFLIVEFNDLSSFGEEKREQGFKIEACYEIV